MSTTPAGGDDGLLPLSAHELLTTTRAVRKRLDLDRPVDRRLVEACVDDALQAPQGSNSPRTHFVVLDDRASIAAVAAIYREQFEQQYVASSAGVFQREEADVRHAEQNRRTQDSVRYLAEHLAEVPVLVIPCITPRLDAVDELPAKQRLATVLPTVWSFMLAARLRGLGTCWTGMTLPREREVAEIAQIPADDVEQVAVLALAHHTGTSFRPAWRPPAADFLHWDAW